MPPKALPQPVIHANGAGPSHLSFNGAVKKGLKTSRYIPVIEEERNRLATIIKDRVIIDKVRLNGSRSEWKNSLVGKFLGSKIPANFLKDKSMIYVR